MAESRLLLVAGLSGAGKSQVLHALEDAGLKALDGLPPALLPSLLSHLRTISPPVAAVSFDPRDPELQEGLERLLEEVEQSDTALSIVFVEASDDVLSQRYQASRRPHPLGGETGSLAEAVERERRLLEGLRARADYILDTSTMTIQQLRRKVLEDVVPRQGSFPRRLTLMSFAFSRGIPPEASLVFDVRFLPNPFYDPDLRPLSGKDPAVQDFVWSRPESGETLSRIRSYLDFCLPRFLAEGKSHLCVAVGCTGGRHRSVAVVERLGRELAGETGWSLRVTHRELDP